LTGKNPAMEPIEKVWDLLTPEQRQDAIAMIQALANRNTAMNGRPAATLLHSTPKVGIGGDFNRIKEWLDPKLESMGISILQNNLREGVGFLRLRFTSIVMTRPGPTFNPWRRCVEFLACRWKKASLSSRRNAAVGQREHKVSEEHTPR